MLIIEFFLEVKIEIKKKKLNSMRFTTNDNNNDIAIFIIEFILIIISYIKK